MSLSLSFTSSRRAGRQLGRWVLPAALVIALTATTGPVSVARAAVDGVSQWMPRPPLGDGRAGLSVETVNGLILATGGFNEATTFDAVEGRRVTGAGDWRVLAPMVTERANHSTAEVGGFVYAAGGFSDIDIEQSVERYDPGSNRWFPSQELPEVRAAAGGAGLGGLFYMAGGFVPNDAQTDLVVTRSVIAYDPARNAWRRVAPMPTARARLELVAAGGFLYAIGGANNRGASLNVVERYNPRYNSWTSVAPMRDSRVIPCAVETSVGPLRVVVVMGGAEFDPVGKFVAGRRTTEFLDLATGRWKTLPVLFPTGRGSLACATEADGTVLALGGVVLDENGGFRYIPDVDALTLRAG